MRHKHSLNGLKNNPLKHVSISSNLIFVNRQWCSGKWTTLYMKFVASTVLPSFVNYNELIALVSLIQFKCDVIAAVQKLQSISRRRCMQPASRVVGALVDGLADARLGRL